MGLSKVLRTEGNDLFVQNVEWVKSKCVDVMWVTVPVARARAISKERGSTCARQANVPELDEESR
jgi:hypothetical protein